LLPQTYWRCHVISWNVYEAITQMQPGDSFFIPCVDCEPLRRKISKTADSMRARVNIRFVVEGEIQGLRTTLIETL
jgi:hypothetical protein